MNREKGNFVLGIQTRNFEKTETIENYVQAKVEQLRKYIKQEKDTTVIVNVGIGKVTSKHKSGEVFRAEINFQVAGSFFRAESEKDDLYAAIDKVKEEMSRVLRENFSKRRDLWRRGSLRFKNMLRGVTQRGK